MKQKSNFSQELSTGIESVTSTQNGTVGVINAVSKLVVEVSNEIKNLYNIVEEG